MSGAFGRAVQLADRFRLFGELGVNYSNQDEDTDLSGSRFTTSLTGFGLRSGIGIVVYSDNRSEATKSEIAFPLSYLLTPVS